MCVSPAAWPRGRWPFKRSGAGGGGRAEHLGCGVFVCVSERSWAEAAERISTEGQAGKTSSSGGVKKKKKRNTNLQQRNVEAVGLGAKLRLFKALLTRRLLLERARLLL